MILHIRIGATYLYAAEPAEMTSLVGTVLHEPSPEIPFMTFRFAERRHTADTKDWWPDNALHVGVNAESGYGGLVWYVSPARALRSGDETSQHCWVSDNPHPPGFDPQVLSDPGAPLCFDARSTLPIEDVRTAVEEFCRLGTGDRPEHVRWVVGEINGERHDSGQGPRW